MDAPQRPGRRVVCATASTQAERAERKRQAQLAYSASPSVLRISSATASGLSK